MKFWLVQGLEDCSITRLLSFIFVNLKSTQKRYRRYTSPIEIINDQNLKQKQREIQRKITEYTNLT